MEGNDGPRKEKVVLREKPISGSGRKKAREGETCGVPCYGKVSKAVLFPIPGKGGVNDNSVGETVQLGKGRMKWRGTFRSGIEKKGK